MNAPLAIAEGVRRWSSGRAPTREEILAEIGRILSERRNVPKPDYARVDRLQGAYDFIAERWPAAQQSLLPE
jgi:hypothetical protein